METTALALRPLGSSETMISALGLGCWQFSKGNNTVGRFWPTLPEEDIVEIVRISLEGGINWFDTAEVYGNGKSEEALADALHQLGAASEHALVATKWWPLLRRARSLRDTFHEREAALKGRHIDLHQVHQPFSLSSVEKQMEEMSALLTMKKVSHAGVSNFNEKRMREAAAVLNKNGYSLASNQVKYSLLDRRIEKNGVLEAAKELGVTIIAYSPLEQGVLTGKFHHNPELIKNAPGPRKYFSQFKEKGLEKTRPLIQVLEAIAQRYHVTPSQVALNWLVTFHGDTVVAIPGASKVSHARDNIGALTFQLTKEELQEIDRVSWSVQ